MDFGDNEVRAKCVGGRTRPLRPGQRRQPLRAAIDPDKAGSLNLYGHNNAASLAVRREPPTNACRLSRNASARFCALAAVPEWVTTQLCLQRTVRKAVIGWGAW
ncbi:MAG: hypothetical protein ACOYJ6_11425 [Caulobacterales bacterium]